MKALIKKLKFGVLITGFVILTSCGSDLGVASTAGMNMIYDSVPSLIITATRYTGNKISNYLQNSALGKGKRLTVRKGVKHNRVLKALPISIGPAGGASLVSSSGY